MRVKSFRNDEKKKHKLDKAEKATDDNNDKTNIQPFKQPEKR